jgi:hypothetical protein
MANVKQDLMNRLGTEKYYAELELGRLAADPNMNYEEKIVNMAFKLEKIAVLNGQIGLANQYFPEVQPPVVAAAPAQPPTQPAGGVVHPGQTFGE